MSKRNDWIQHGLFGPPGSLRRRLCINGLSIFGFAILWLPAFFDVDEQMWGLAAIAASMMFSNLDSIAAEVRQIRERLDEAIGQTDTPKSE